MGVVWYVSPWFIVVTILGFWCFCMFCLSWNDPSVHRRRPTNNTTNNRSVTAVRATPVILPVSYPGEAPTAIVINTNIGNSTNNNATHRGNSAHNTALDESEIGISQVHVLSPNSINVNPSDEYINYIVPRRDSSGNSHQYSTAASRATSSSASTNNGFVAPIGNPNIYMQTADGTGRLLVVAREVVAAPSVSATAIAAAGGAGTTSGTEEEPAAQMRPGRVLSVATNVLPVASSSSRASNNYNYNYNGGNSNNGTTTGTSNSTGNNVGSSTMAAIAVPGSSSNSVHTSINRTNSSNSSNTPSTTTNATNAFSTRGRSRSIGDRTMRGSDNNSNHTNSSNSHSNSDVNNNDSNVALQRPQLNHVEAIEQSLPTNSRSSSATSAGTTSGSASTVIALPVDAIPVSAVSIS